MVSINPNLARTAAELRATYGLKLPDALQVATAIASGCDGFLTNDTSLKRVRELQILVVEELEV
jgi:predicted nucleic acid-binding protein